jgi:serine/threonine-protein kinase TTK/MPS1
MEEFREQEAKNRKRAEELRAREESLAQEEKENLVSAESGTDEGNVGVSVGNKRHSPPLSSRSTVASRASSVLPTRSASHTGYSSASRPLADVPVPQRGLSHLQILPGSGRAGRILKSKYSASGGSGFGRIAEVESTESEVGNEYYTGEETDTGMYVIGVYYSKLSVIGRC